MNYSALSFSTGSLRRTFGTIIALVFACASLIPQSGICFCPDCSCPRNVANQQQTVKEAEAKHCCCINEPEKPESWDKSSKSCKCGCDTTTVMIKATALLGVLRPDCRDDIQSDSPYLHVGTGDCLFSRFTKILKNTEYYQVYPPPVRLHLLLSVILN